MHVAVQMIVNGLFNIGYSWESQRDVTVLFLDDLDGYALVVSIHFP